MAGAGYKNWATGAVLTSSDLNTYIADQVIFVFASSSARSSAISSPAEGMVSYLKDTNAIEYYDGSSWGGIGDITAVNAGTNIDVSSSTGPTPTVALAIDAAVAIGADGSGVDVTFHSGTAGDFALWDASDKALEFTDSKITMNDNLIETPEMKDYAETVNAIGGTGGGTQDIDLTAGNVVTATVDTSANTFTFSNPSATGKSCSFTLILTNGGSQTVNWPGAVKWAGGSAPTLTTTGVDVLAFTTVDAGTTWYGFPAGLAMA
jgi:hypothetical protein